MCRPISESKLPSTASSKRGTLIGAISLALLVLSASLTMPHLQSRRDEFGCDTMCFGGMTSTRSLLALVGSSIMGRLSDTMNRKVCLYIGTAASLVGMVIAANAFSIQGMWISMIPGALLQQNYSIMKALFSDYHASPSDRATSVGMLGMSVGLAFMVGPLAGATVLKTFEQANLVGIVFIILSGVLVHMLPDATKKEEPRPKEGVDGSVWSFLNVKAAQTPAAILFMAIRLFMALAFHIFSTIWSPSLKSRFDFGPSDHGKFMSFIGLTYALSQGFIAKYLLRACGGNTSHKARVGMILASCVALGCGRYIAFRTTSLAVVYLVFGAIVTALGLVNTILTADTSYLASSNEIGSLFGILSAVESGAGMLGPLLGGSLSLIDPVRAPLMAVVGLYVLVFGLVSWGYEGLIMSKAPPATNGGESLSTATGQEQLIADKKTN